MGGECDGEVTTDFGSELFSSLHFKVFGTWWR